MSAHEVIPVRYTYLTVAAAVATLSIKFYAAWITASVGLLSDAMESIVNLVTSVVLVVLVRIAKAPPDEDHPYGHDKAEYFANGVQGTLIILAAAGIITAAANRFSTPVVLEAGPLGLSLNLVAALINVATARLLTKAGRQARSKALEGEAAHLMSDVWTSIAVLCGVGLVYATGLKWLDPLVAIGMSVAILCTGVNLLKGSVAGLMDKSLPEETQREVTGVLDRYCQEHQMTYHALRGRASGARSFISVHILVPGSWSVSEGHRLSDEIENQLTRTVPGASVITHLEPLEEAISFDDIHL